MPSRLFLAPGASGGASSMRPYVDALTRLDVAAQAIDVPKGRAERAVPALLAAAPPALDAVVGGRSYGGRVASLAAADERYGGLVLISYPLHPPGRPDAADDRTAHWPSIECPVLLLAGGADPFSRPELLRMAVKRLRNAELVLYPAGRHGLLDELDDLARRIAKFVAAVGRG